MYKYRMVNNFIVRSQNSSLVFDPLYLHNTGEEKIIAPKIFSYRNRFHFFRLFDTSFFFFSPLLFLLFPSLGDKNDTKWSLLNRYSCNEIRFRFNLPKWLVRTSSIMYNTSTCVFQFDIKRPKSTLICSLF